MGITHIAYPHTVSCNMSTLNVITLCFPPILCREVFPKSSLLFLCGFVPLSVNLIRIIIRAQASEPRASASPSVDLPPLLLPPPRFLPLHPPPPPLVDYTFRSFSRSSWCLLSSPKARATSWLTGASLPFISHFSVFAHR